jgi:hypothetical protein
VTGGSTGRPSDGEVAGSGVGDDGGSDGRLPMVKN